MIPCHAVRPFGQPVLEPGDHRPALGIRIRSRMARAAAAADWIRCPFHAPAVACERVKQRSLGRRRIPEADQQ